MLWHLQQVFRFQVLPHNMGNKLHHPGQVYRHIIHTEPSAGEATSELIDSRWVVEVGVGVEVGVEKWKNQIARSKGVQGAGSSTCNTTLSQDHAPLGKYGRRHKELQQPSSPTSHIHHIRMTVPSRSGHHRPSSCALRIQNISDKLALLFEPQCVTKWKANRPDWTRIPPWSPMYPHVSDPSYSWTMQECSGECAALV